MNTPPSRLLMRLDAAIAAESDPVRADCLRAEQATYMARQGRQEDARALLDELRRRYDTRPRVEITVWINLAEGMIDFCCGDGTHTYDKVLRAHALSTAAGLPPMRALTAAWLAHLEYTRHGIEPLTRYVVLALETSRSDHHAARSRSSLVVAEALQFAGRLDLALPWYRRAREHANSESDEETISAIMLNMAGIRFDHLRQVELSGDGDAGQGQHALLGAESTKNYDQMVGSIGQSTFVPLLQAQILSLHGKHREALELYRQHIAASVHQRQERLQSYMLSDQAWCKANTGQAQAALDDIEAALANLGADTQVDDRASTHSRVAQVFRLLGVNDEDAAKHEARAKALWAEFAEFQSKIVANLSGVTETGRT